MRGLVSPDWRSAATRNANQFRKMTPDKDAARALEACQEAVSRLQSMVSVVRLSGSLGHEFNNLMQTTIGALQLIQKLIEADRASETKPFIASALRAAQSASAINQQLVSLARPDSSKPQPLDLNLLVADMSELLRQSLPRSVALTTDLARELWPTQCDPHRAKIALLDLFFSVLDTMPGRRALTITTCNRYVDDSGAPSTDLVRGSYACVEATCSGDRSVGSAPGEQADDAQDHMHWPGLEAVREFARTNRGDARFERRDERATAATLYLPRLDAGDAGVPPG